MEYKSETSYNIVNGFYNLNTYRELIPEREYLNKVKYDLVMRVGGEYVLRRDSVKPS